MQGAQTAEGTDDDDGLELDPHDTAAAGLGLSKGPHSARKHHRDDEEHSSGGRRSTSGEM